MNQILDSWHVKKMFVHCDLSRCQRAEDNLIDFLWKLRKDEIHYIQGSRNEEKNMYLIPNYILRSSEMLLVRSRL